MQAISNRLGISTVLDLYFKDVIFTFCICTERKNKTNLMKLSKPVLSIVLTQRKFKRQWFALVCSIYTPSKVFNVHLQPIVLQDINTFAWSQYWRQEHALGPKILVYFYVIFEKKGHFWRQKQFPFGTLLGLTITRSFGGICILVFSIFEQSYPLPKKGGLIFVALLNKVGCNIL